MALFFQLDIRSDFGLPFKDGSHLVAFMCPTHNEPPISDLYDDSPLLPGYWDANDGHFAVFLFPPTKLAATGEVDPFIESYRLQFETATEEVQDLGDFHVGSYDFKVGGVPGWINYQINKRCACGERMSFVCQVSENFGFKQTAGAPEQPDSFSSSEYCLFLGNQVYVMACEQQCDPRAVVVGCDN